MTNDENLAKLQKALEAAESDVALAQQRLDEILRLRAEQTEAVTILDRMLTEGQMPASELSKVIGQRALASHQAASVDFTLESRKSFLATAIATRDRAAKALGQFEYTTRLEDLREKDAAALEQLMVAVRACAARGVELQERDAKELQEVGTKAGRDPIRDSRAPLIVTDNLADKLAEIVSDEFRRARHRPFNFAPSPVATEVSHD